MAFHLAPVKDEDIQAISLLRSMLISAIGPVDYPVLKTHISLGKFIRKFEDEEIETLRRINDIVTNQGMTFSFKPEIIRISLFDYTRNNVSSTVIGRENLQKIISGLEELLKYFTFLVNNSSQATEIKGIISKLEDLSKTFNSLINIQPKEIKDIVLELKNLSEALEMKGNFAQKLSEALELARLQLEKIQQRLSAIENSNSIDYINKLLTNS